MAMHPDFVYCKQSPTKAISRTYSMDSNTNSNILARNNGVKKATEDLYYQVKNRKKKKTF